MMLTSTLKVLQLLWSFATLWMVFNNIMAAKGSTCGPPTPPYGSVIIHPSVQGQHKNGSLVLFGCKQGFYLVGPPLIKCTGNTWTKIKFRCIGFCPDFRHILNGQVLHVSPKVGKAAVEFRCNEKYRLIGRTRLECVNGRWNAELPFCKKLKSCERLRAPANGTLYGDDIAHGAKVSFTCLTGFELFGLQTITCDNGAWSGSVPSCKAYCMRIRAPSNGRKHGVLFSHGSVVSFECKTGYNLVGDRVLWCLNGKWNSTVPVCNVMLCPRPVIPSNSYIIHPRANQDSYLHGTKLFLACLDGHYLIGSPIMDCNQTEWIKMDFSCIASCPVLGSIKNGIITPVTLKGGGEVKIKCHTNHTLVGSPSLICENGRWNDSLPTCGAPCDEPAIPAHGWKNNLDYRHGRSVKFYCSGKYDRIGAFSITCNDGTWDNQVPVCKARCSDPGSPSHGRRRGDIFRHNSWVEFLCNANYQLEGDQWIQCVDGSWSDPLPKCIAPCSDPGIPYQGNRIGQDFRHDRTVRFTCPRDYVMEGVSEIRCSDGKWSNNKPSCKAPCDEATNPTNGRKWGDSTHGSTVRFACWRGYQRVGVVSITCNDGIWDNQAPVCKGVCGRPRIPIKGRLQGSSFLDGDEVTFSCERNYDLFGKAKLLCAGRSWNSPIPECKARCRFMGRPEHGFYLKGARRAGDMIRHGERISYRCFNGYTLIGANMQECDNGRWTNHRPACKASCRSPGGIDNGRKLSHDYSHGKTVRYECDSDYTLEGENRLTCDDGTWNFVPPKCRAPCSNPGSPVHGGRRGDSLMHHSWVQFFCDQNYQLEGDRQIRCDDGSWTGSLPDCITFCPDPGVPDHGRRLGDDFRDGQKVTFKCDNNYDLFGNNTVQCSGGVWSGSRPECKGRCTFGGSPESGYTVRQTLFRGARLKHGNGVQFACKATYILVGSSSLHCDNGNWNGSVPVCKASCEDPGFIEHGKRTGTRSDFSHGQLVTYKCKQGYSLEGNNQLKCENGEWDSERPQCKASCKDPGQIKNGMISGDYSYGSSITFRCDRGYHLRGPLVLTCEEGKWNGSIPECITKCNDPGEPDNGVKEGTDYRSGSNVTFSCNPQFDLVGSQMIICRDGQWSDFTPTCTYCGRPLGMENSNIPDSWIRSPYWITRPKFARLNGYSAWCATRQTYLQIDLGRTYKLTAIATQGGTGLNRWVERYKVGFNIGSIRVMYSESGSQKVIEGNKDASSIVKYWFNEPFVTKAVRIYPVVGASTVCLRTEIYGCDPRPDCILVGSSFWGLWSYRGNSYNYYQAFITKLNATHLDFALKFNNRRTRSHKRTDPVLIIDKIPEMKDITVNSQVIAVHRPRTLEWYRVGKVTDTLRTSAHVTFHDGQRRWVRLQQLRLVKRPRFCNDGLK